MGAHHILYMIVLAFIGSWGIIDGLSSAIDFLNFKRSLIGSILVLVIYLAYYTVHKKSHTKGGLKFKSLNSKIKFTALGAIFSLWIPLLLSNNNTQGCDVFDEKEFVISVLPFQNLSGCQEGRDETCSISVFKNLSESVDLKDAIVVLCSEEKEQVYNRDQAIEFGIDKNVDIVIYGALHTVGDSTELLVNYVAPHIETGKSITIKNKEIISLFDIYDADSTIQISQIVLWTRINYLAANVGDKETIDFIFSNINKIKNKDESHYVLSLLLIRNNLQEVAFEILRRYPKKLGYKSYGILAQAEAIHGNHDEVIRLIDNNPELLKYNMLWIRYIQSLLALNKIEDAHDFLKEKYRSKIEVGPEAHYLLSSIFMKVNEYEKAFFHFKKFINDYDVNEIQSEVYSIGCYLAYKVNNYYAMCEYLAEVDNSSLNGQLSLYVSKLNNICNVSEHYDINLNQIDSIKNAPSPENAYMFYEKGSFRILLY